MHLSHARRDGRKPCAQTQVYLCVSVCVSIGKCTRIRYAVHSRNLRSDVSTFVGCSNDSDLTGRLNSFFLARSDKDVEDRAKVCLFLLTEGAVFVEPLLNARSGESRK